MVNWLKTLDKILRGEVTHPEAMKDGQIDIPLAGMVMVIISLGMIYGACMGSFSLFKSVDPALGTGMQPYLQLIASTVKIPALFLLTLLVTFPSLYVFNALMGSRLTLPSLLRLLFAALGVNLAVLASLGPIVAFFSVSTTSYNFMKLFNVLVMAVSGFLGLAFLVQTLNRLAKRSPHLPANADPMANESGTSNANLSQADELDTAEGDAELQGEGDATPTEDSLGALDRVDDRLLTPHVQLVFRMWVCVFGLVGAQMGWVLRPFIGNPEQPFTWFRHRESNFFQELGRTLLDMLNGG